MPFSFKIDTIKIGDDRMKDSILKKYEDLKSRLANNKLFREVSMEKWASSLDFLMGDMCSSLFLVDHLEDSFGESERILLMDHEGEKDPDRALGVITIGMKSLSIDYINPETGAYSFVSIEEEVPGKTELVAHICSGEESSDVIDIASNQVAMNDRYYSFLSEDVLEKASMVNALKEMNGYFRQDASSHK